MSEPSASPPPDGDAQHYELLLSGHDQILRGSDTAVLVAFAAIALKELKGDKDPGVEIGFGFLLFSVLMCAVIHFAVGGAYVRRAKRLIRRGKEVRQPITFRGLYMLLAWFAGLAQVVCIVIGLLLVLLPEPPAFLKEYLVPYFL